MVLTALNARPVTRVKRIRLTHSPLAEGEGNGRSKRLSVDSLVFGLAGWPSIASTRALHRRIVMTSLLSAGCSGGSH
jgi:hypothetical protein